MNFIKFSIFLIPNYFINPYSIYVSIYLTFYLIVTNQNEILIKRVDELEMNNNSEKSRLNRSYSTSNFNNTTRYSNAESSASKENYFIKEKEEIMEWKKDIELSIEKISEKVAFLNNTNILACELEKRFDDFQKDFIKLTKEIEENLDQAKFLKKSFEKYEKSEKLINELITQISNVKTSNIKWQSDFLKNMNEINEKFMNFEIQLDQLDKQDKVIHKKWDAIQIDLKRKEINITESFDNTNRIFEDRLGEVRTLF